MGSTHIRLVWTMIQVVCYLAVTSIGSLLASRREFRSAQAFGVQMNVHRRGHGDGAGQLSAASAAAATEDTLY
ncbi:hypothetical protein ABZP36_004139 [Zizania latifolia]